MKKLFVKLSVLMFGLLAGTAASWGQEQKIFLGALQAQTAATSTGSGQVELTLLDLSGKPMENPIFVGSSGLNATNPAGPAATAQMIGASLFAMDGIETPVEVSGAGEQIYMTSYLYFHAAAVPDNGSYLADWTFSDPSITRIDTLMGNGVDIPLLDYCFKLLPDSNNNTTYPSGNIAAVAAAVSAAPNNIYAVFKQYLLSNPQVTNGTLDAVAGNTANLQVVVDVEGDITTLDDDMSDFGTTLFTNNENGQWAIDMASATKAVLSAQKARITIPVVFTAQSGIITGEYRTTMTLRMAGLNPSTLNISLTVNALDPARPEAVLFSGKDEKESGTLANLLAKVGNYDNPIIKLNKNCSGFELTSQVFTLDLNGNNIDGVTVSGGELTIAYSKYGGRISNTITLNAGKLILNGGEIEAATGVIVKSGATLEQNGATIHATGIGIENAGTAVVSEGETNGLFAIKSTGELTVKGGKITASLAGGYAIWVDAGTAAIQKGTISGDAYGIYTKATTTTEKLAAIYGGTNAVYVAAGSTTLNNGKFDGDDKPLAKQKEGTLNLVSGYFKTKVLGVDVPVGKKLMNVSAGTEYNAGYIYYVGDDETAQLSGVGVCRIGTTPYATLEDALAYANNNPSKEVVIVMLNDYVLPAGYYTLPAKATLVVPMSDTQTKEVNQFAPRVSFHDMDRSHPYVQPTEFRRLTFANGVNMEVHGAIEVTCSQFASNEAYTSQPYGPYGHLVMETGSHMTLQSGSELRVWGYMTGAGETDARRNSTVREMFQMGDWKGALTSVRITGMYPAVGDDSDKKIFPVSQYFIQNIEAPIKYHPGAVLSTSATVAEGLLGALAVTMAATDIKVIGVASRDAAIFLMDEKADAENTWVRKWYDAENDIQVYDVNSAAHIGSMVLDMGELSMAGIGTIPIRLNSAMFDLPITTNMKIHLLSGNMDFQQNTSLLPGAEVEVDKESTVSVAKSAGDPEHTGALYVYDADDWGKYAYGNSYEEGAYKAYTKVVRYAPSWGGRPTKRDEQTCPPDAAINVHGTFETSAGYVYTSAHGANIFSSNEDAGTFIFNQDASSAGTRTVYQVEGSGTYCDQEFTSAALKNEDGSHENTKTAQQDDAYCYRDYQWTIMKVDEDNPCFMVDNHSTFYAKPQDYVAVVATKDEYGEIIGNDDYTYSDANGDGRLFILMQDQCQWWEVEKKDNLYHCLHPNNDTYYYWGLDETTLTEGWMEKKFTITWLNWDSTEIKTYDHNFDPAPEIKYEVPYGTQAEYLGSNPTREPDIDYTYDFTGWAPALGKVTSDVTYTATYAKKERKYTIIFREEGGVEIERQFLTHNAVPVCENMPTKAGHYLEWQPAIAAVSGDATYTAHWLEEKPDEWDVTFLNNAGDTLQATQKVSVEANPVYSGSTPDKENADHTPYTSNEYECSFWGWNVVIDGAIQTYAAGEELPKPTDNMTFTAVYTMTEKTYNITFLDENSDEIETTAYHYGETPVCSTTPTKEPDAQNTYLFAWDPQIQTVMGEQTYRATFTPQTNKYTVTLRSNNSAVCTFTGAGIYDYDDANPVTIGITLSDPSYVFSGWQELNGDTRTSIDTLVTADITLTAIVTKPSLPDLILDGDDAQTIGVATEIQDLVLTSTGLTSSQLKGTANLKLWGNAYFELIQSINGRQWYAVAVPWPVDAATGIFDAADNHLTLGTDFDLISFNSQAHAAGLENRDCWSYLEYQADKTMQPGKLYMIYFAANQTKIRFQKKAKAALLTERVNVQTYPSAVDAQHANWNAIANPSLYYAYLNEGGTHIGQLYNPGADDYTEIDLSSQSLIVGQPVFVQAPAAKTIVAYDDNASYASHAPRRMPAAAAEEAFYTVEISRDGMLNGRLFVAAAEEKEDTYTIGEDVMKMGVSARKAQMWIERYGVRLCMNTVAFADDRAEYPLAIYAPVAGEYTIAAPAAETSATALYLTCDGEAIWNLSNGAYTLSLERGTTHSYGLRISARSPQVATGCDEVIADGAEQAQKVLVGDRLYIIRGDKVYTPAGQVVK
ncbi:MAG: hypothetical protein J5902_07755 [Paludibacteraceae bacterium]|nr:hypothetical protein [Paludibacteraceae bacterium]